MKTSFWGVGLIALLLAGPSMASAAAKDTAAADKTLDKRIEHRMKADGSLKKYDVDVSVTNHIATLTGNVATEAQRRRAGRIANIKGITRVENQITVNASAAKGTTGKIEDKVKEGAEKTKEALSKTGEVITDGWITARVHTGFVGEDLLKNSDISVDTNDHVVTLRGRVTSAAGRTKAVQIAKKVEGVHQVND
jgi:osmotically-inducible protein OsmY